MITAARRAHPDLTFAIASITDLPHRAGTFAGVLLWYSTIHTPPDRLPSIFTEAVRVLRPGGQWGTATGWGSRPQVGGLS